MARSPFAAKNGDICQIGKISGPALAVKKPPALGNVEQFGKDIRSS
jgi:hypothetical protein